MKGKNIEKALQMEGESKENLEFIETYKNMEYYGIGKEVGDIKYLYETDSEDVLYFYSIR